MSEDNSVIVVMLIVGAILTMAIVAGCGHVQRTSDDVIEALEEMCEAGVLPCRLQDQLCPGPEPDPTPLPQPCAAD